jgi:CARDB
MRQPVRLVCAVTLATAAFAVLAVPAAAQRPDLVVESAGEPPDSAIADNNDFLVSFTVGNQGRARARRASLARAYLSVGRVLSADDRRRNVGSRRVRALRAGRSQTRRLTVRIPPAFRLGEYFLIICADVRNVVRESNDRANCHVSGQKIQVVGPGQDPRRGAAGAPGPPGPVGATGPAGPAGPGLETIKIPRQTLSLGSPTIDGPEARPGDDEGSTQQVDLLEVEGVRIRALCVTTSNGDNELPGTDGDGDGHEGVDNDFDTDEDGDEAKILLYLDRDQGTFNFSGPHGKRFGVNAGFGNTTTSIQDPADDTGGNGKHMAIATASDPESRIVGDADDTDATVGADSTAPLNEPEDDWEQGYRSGSVYVATSAGTEFALHAYAAVNTLGTTGCTFGGYVTVVNR